MCFCTVAGAEVDVGDLSGDVMGKVFMEGEFLDGDILKISVLSQDMIQPVLGIAFHLKYDFDFLKFLKYEPGEFLERGGDPFYLVENKDGKLIFGETLRREDSFPVGGDVIADFYFQIVEEDEFNFTFENGVVSTLDVVRQDLDRIIWEDLISERDQGDGYLLASDYQNSVFGKDGFSNLSSVFSLLVVVLAIVAALVLIFSLKKQEKKRPESSVNFK